MTDHNLNNKLTHEIEIALAPGQFIRYGDMFEFIEDLEKVQEKLAALVDGGKAAWAVRLYEVFLSGCYDKMEERDDSGGNMGMFFDGLFCDWVKARQKAGCPGTETVAQILKWKQNDDYGLCFKIEKDVVKVLDREGYRLFVAHFQSAIEQALTKLGEKQTKPVFEYENDIRLPAMSLRYIYQAKDDTQSYAALCEQLGMSPRDCEHLAEMEMAKAHWDKALAWVVKGLTLEPTRNWHNESSHSLEHLKPKILGKLGRKEEALTMAWGDFEKYPCDMAYEELMQYVPKNEKAKWHERAMEIADRGDMDIWKKLALLVEQHLDEPVMKGVFSSHMQKEPEEIIAIRNQADEIRKSIRKKQSEHDNILHNLGQSRQTAGNRVAEVLKGYCNDIDELKHQLQENEENLKHLEEKNSVDSQIENILQHKHKNINALPFQKRKEIAQIFLNQIVLKEDHVMLETKSITSPIIGLLKKRQGFRSNLYSYLDLEWL